MPKHAHQIDWHESFHLRKPVLEKMLGKAQWKVSADGKSIEFAMPLSNYSKHERDIIEFALNPYETAQNIFGGLNQAVAQNLAEALAKLFGPNGFYAKPIGAARR